MPDEGESLPRLAGVPSCIEVDGKKYRVAPLGIGELAELEQWAQEEAAIRPFRRLRAKLEELGETAISGEARDALVAAADKEARDPEGPDRISDSFEGVRRSMAMMLRSCQPEITDQEIDRILTLRGIRAIRTLIEEINFPGGNRPKNPPAGGDTEDPPVGD
jgi:hypothetical protein